MNIIDLPSDKELAGKIVEAETQHTARKMEMGWVGRLFGGATEKPGNIAGAVIVLSMMMIAVASFWPPNDPQFPRRELFTLFGGLATLALGYLFGRSNSPT